MLRPRIIPTLLIHQNGLTKTINFKNKKYIGDPINIVKIFNEKRVDELIILDIDATVMERDPNYSLIKNISQESRMPLCYGGGIKNIEQANKIIGLGVEKLAFSSAAIENPILLSEIVNIIGSQSVVCVLDTKYDTIQKKHVIWTHNGIKNQKIFLQDAVINLQKIGIGEIVINSIDKDGTMSGYDINMIKNIIDLVNIPLTILGGAGSFEDIKDVINNFGLIGVAAGSLFIYKGVYKAVLVNYINNEQKKSLLL